MNSFQFECKKEVDPGMEADLKKWIEGTLGEPLGDDFHGALKSGVKLCQYESVRTLAVALVHLR